MHRRDKKHSPVPVEEKSRKENGPSLTACIKPSRTIRSAHSEPDVSDGRLPSIIVIYSQYHGTHGYCNDVHGRDGVHQGNPTRSKKRDGARRKVGLSSAGCIAQSPRM